MKFLIVDTYYEPFLQSFYKNQPGLASKSYREQMSDLLAQCFGTADFYSSNLKKLGHEAEEVIPNYNPAQNKWIEERGIQLSIPENQKYLKHWQLMILRNQIEYIRPNILYVQDINWIDNTFLQDVRPYVDLIVGQNACPLRQGIDYGCYDLLLTSFPHYVDFFRSKGVDSRYFRLAFEPKVLDSVKKGSPTYSTVFIGGYSVHHQKGTELLEKLANYIQIDFWGYSIDGLPPNSPIRQHYHGEVWGIEMYRILAQSKVALNRHINVAGRYANNMRLYEATGVGSCLLTEMKDNLHELFDVDREVIGYTSIEDCIEKARYLLENEHQRSEIAKAGQKRTLQEHTYLLRMQELDELIASHLAQRTSYIGSRLEGVNMKKPTQEKMFNLTGKILLCTDVPVPSLLDDLNSAILNELVQSGFQVTVARPENCQHLHKFQSTEAPYKCIDFQSGWDVERTISDLSDARRILSNTSFDLVIFTDLYLVSNLAAKQAVDEVGIPYIVFLGSTIPDIEDAFASHCKTVVERYNKARAILALSEEALHRLHQHFGLPSQKGKVVGTRDSILSFISPDSNKLSWKQDFRHEVKVQSLKHVVEWEYLPEGWQTKDSQIKGWNVESVLDSQKQRLPQFLRSVRGTAPLASDYGQHNTYMSYAYVLALAARKKDSISLLDWGGGIGQYYFLSQALLQNVKVQYHCKEVPLLCEGGRELLPDSTFFEEDEECFKYNYDLVIVSGSLQYAQHWQQLLQKLILASRPYLYVTRLPMVHQSRSFAVVQRPYNYGYLTEYIGWFLNRQDFLDCSRSLGAELVREFLVCEKILAKGAPEQADYRGFLFKCGM